MGQKHSETMVFYRIKKVKELTGLSQSTIYRMIAAGKFPRPVKVNQHSSVWPSSTIREWQEEVLRESE